MIAHWLAAPTPKRTDTALSGIFGSDCRIRCPQQGISFGGAHDYADEGRQRKILAALDFLCLDANRVVARLKLATRLLRIYLGEFCAEQQDLR